LNIRLKLGTFSGEVDAGSPQKTRPRENLCAGPNVELHGVATLTMVEVAFD
jgi:hypothetical protein